MKLIDRYMHAVAIIFYWGGIVKVWYLGGRLPVGYTPQLLIDMDCPGKYR